MGACDARLDDRVCQALSVNDVGTLCHDCSSNCACGVLWGAVQAINAGVTTVADWAHNLRSEADIDANVRALHDSGIRARLHFGGKVNTPPGSGQHPVRPRWHPVNPHSTVPRELVERAGSCRTRLHQGDLRTHAL
ncbi:hypothetical protein GCM10010350_72540 [Streptomyces galilaeus]|nr:hypothetical protein GCM10010350_72540 [Streptomyces galilaeus]